MAETTITPVLLAGGSGTRLWPLSRELYPKQLLPLTGDATMLQATAARLDGLALDAPIVMCNEEHRFMVAQQLRAIGFEDPAVLLEPEGRNTAPAAAVAAMEATARRKRGDQDPLLLVLPADHVIGDVKGFQAAVTAGAELAREGRLITFGVVPASPETGYGYIRRGDGVVGDCGFPVEEFVEKPDIETASAYVESGEYYWNSGMFLFRASSFLAELTKFVPEIVESCRQAHDGARRETDFVWLEESAFKSCPVDSIDYAVMEKTEQGVVIPVDVAWSDIGSWAALADLGPRNGDGNVLLGDVLNHESLNCYLRADHRLLATVGLENLIVVETADAVLVAHQERVQEVKHIVERLKEAQRAEVAAHRRVYRPWGSYESIDAGPGWQVKCIRVTAGASLSLQMHNRRAEHWVVVKGAAEVTRGEEVFVLRENESTYIPRGEKHRLSNPGSEELELIEVQSGDYVGEDDIVRFEDLYGR